MPQRRFRGVEFQHSQAGSSSQFDDLQQSQQPDAPQHEPLADDQDDEPVIGDLQIQGKLNEQILCLFHFNIILCQDVIN